MERSPVVSVRVQIALGVLVVAVIILAAWFGWRMERARFDACIAAVGDARYCHEAHQSGARGPLPVSPVPHR